MSTEAILEAKRQAQICNACRYCEGYCSVFPALTSLRDFSDGDITQLANLCHNCRGCYYACQYTAPHEFDLNFPRALAEVRQESWQDHAWPGVFAKAFDKNGVVIATVLGLGVAFIFALTQFIKPESGEGFYAHMSHALMVGIFAPGFILPLLTVVYSLWKYWQSTGGGSIGFRDVTKAIHSAGTLKNLGGGHGKGCNFEDEDRYSNARRWMHQATVLGFLLCFASTSSGTILHYGFGMEAPYPLFSIPKMFGVPGGIILCIGTAGLAWLKTKADPKLGAPKVWGGEMAFVGLLFTVSLTGLLLFAATGTGLVAWMLPVHLGSVLALFVLTPYTKMAHGFYRMTALIKDQQRIRLEQNPF